MSYPNEKLHEIWDEIAVEPATLYLVATPIGNIGDISIRALATLSKVDTVLAEDTRTSANLLNQFGIKPFYLSYHLHNFQSRIPHVLELLEDGKSIAQISDAGMPAISDPGAELVDACLEAGFEVRVVPGPSASTAAVALSGLDSSDFRFIGFLPLKDKLRNEYFDSIKNYQGISIIFEAPHRIIKTLEDMIEAGFSQRKIYLGRELTKFYEESIRTTVEEALTHFQENAPRGEFVIVLDRASDKELALDEEQEVNEIEAIILNGIEAGDTQKTILADLQGKTTLRKSELKKLIESMQEDKFKH